MAKYKYINIDNKNELVRYDTYDVIDFSNGERVINTQLKVPTKKQKYSAACKFNPVSYSGIDHAVYHYCVFTPNNAYNIIDDNILLTNINVYVAKNDIGWGASRPNIFANIYKLTTRDTTQGTWVKVYKSINYQRMKFNSDFANPTEDDRLLYFELAPLHGQHSVLSNDSVLLLTFVLEANLNNETYLSNDYIYADAVKMGMMPNLSTYHVDDKSGSSFNTTAYVNWNNFNFSIATGYCVHNWCVPGYIKYIKA